MVNSTGNYANHKEIVEAQRDASFTRSRNEKQHEMYGFNPLRLKTSDDIKDQRQRLKSYSLA